MKFLLDLATSDPSNKALMNAHFIPDGVDCTGVVGIANSTGECGKKFTPNLLFTKLFFTYSFLIRAIICGCGKQNFWSHRDSILD